MKQRIAPSFTGEIGGYVSQPFFYESDLTANQVRLDPSMDVRSISTYLPLYLIMDPARRAQYFRRAGVLQS